MLTECKNWYSCPETAWKQWLGPVGSVSQTQLVFQKGTLFLLPSASGPATASFHHQALCPHILPHSDTHG